MMKLSVYKQNQTYKNAPLTRLLADKTGDGEGDHYEKARDEELIN